MAAFPLLLVVRPESVPALTEALVAARVHHQVASAAQAASAVREGWAERVLCERVPGWQALASRVDIAGGVTIVWASSVTDADRRDHLPRHLLSAPDLGALPRALDDANRLLQKRRDERRSTGGMRRRQMSDRASAIARHLASQLDLETLAVEIRHTLRALCEADTCELWCVDAETGDLVTAPAAEHPRRLPYGEGLVGRVAHDAQAHLLDEERPAAEDVAAALALHAAFAVPLVHRGDVLGVIELVRASPGGPFDGVEVQTLVDLAPHVAIALHNAQLTQGLRDAQAVMLTTNAELERRVEERTQQISRAKQEWEATFDAIEEPIALQSGFVLRRVNRAYAVQAGVPLTQLAGRKCHEVLANRPMPCPGCPLAAKTSDLHAEVSPREGWVYRFSGFKLPGGTRDDVVIHYQDVSRQRALEARLRESERLASVGQLASGAAHEINNPLGFVTSNLASLRNALQDMSTELSGLTGPQEELRTLLSEAEAMIADAMNGTKRVTNIVKALRELSRQEIGRAELSSVNASVERAVRAEAPDAAESVQLESRARAEIIPLQLDRAVGHLVKNARQSSGGKARVHVRTRDDGETIRIEVVDDGEGIPPENLHRIFEPFFTTRGIGQGMGLGLTAAYGIVRRAGGTIEVKSQPGQGATFAIVLPRVAA